MEQCRHCGGDVDRGTSLLEVLGDFRLCTKCWERQKERMTDSAHSRAIDEEAQERYDQLMKDNRG